MNSKSHKDYKIEKERLDYTKEYLDKTLKAIEEYKSNTFVSMQEDMLDTDMSENSSAYIDMMLKSQVMDFAEKNYYAYKRAMDKPYFARIDYTAKGEEKVQRIYIGKTSLMKAEDNEMLIVDWRAPVASIYYDGRLGEVEYETADGIENGNLSLKRQLSIEKGELSEVLDIDITATDAFLQASLSANAESRLKDIASTIQAEQNKVIRAPLHQPIIIQGAAGSGKTTIALHRIAYFMYTYEKTFDPDNFLIIAPNNLFINYISEVLPELGVENVRQSTYVDFMKLLLGAKPKVNSRDDFLAEIIESKDDSTGEGVNVAKFKGSKEFIDIINSYIDSIEKEFLPEDDFVVRGKLLMENSEVRKMFLEDLTIYSFEKRIKEIEKSLKNKLSLVDKDIIKKIEFSYDMAISKERKSSGDPEERRKRVVALIEQRDEKLKLAEKEIKNAVKDYSKKFNIKKLNDYYKEVLSEKSLYEHSKGILSKKEAKAISRYSLERFNDKKIELEDLAPLVYLKHKIFGFDKKINVRSVVIDEAQDFSIFEFYALKEALGTTMFSLLGDMSQGIYSYRSFDSWQDVIELVFKNDKANYMTLVQSYRTTIEVMNLANEVIKALNNPDTVIAKPVIRHGEKPEYREFDNKDILIEGLEEKILKRQGENYKSIAILCKTLKECKSLKKLLDKSGKIQSVVLSDKNMEYEAGVILVPSHLAKGLEFDNVFIVNIGEEYGDSELDIKLLYVAITRTLHRLHIYSIKGKTPLLNDIKVKDSDIFS
ncbi:RNA polymerase recycling motor HelD [Clostridium cylindrosporum]|uniref:DNA 3'-5' helicase n=1 Tax=Clostridium cylindrosporum DSM 605 TaxID=1121307 RepID=A0A0J8D5N5_CLOCY|nr:RNA polymerase recycling motor HelD [Clostridium cylindrosporum]KMT21152.1 helicase IV [Clostridium cylindrosporum DSM 605]